MGKGVESIYRIKKINKCVWLKGLYAFEKCVWKWKTFRKSVSNEDGCWEIHGNINGT